MRSPLVSPAVTLIISACGPTHSHVERSVIVQATIADVYPHVADLKKFVVWSPWSGRDPNAKNAFSDPSSGLNAWYSWEGNDDVGSGKMTVVREEAGKSVTQNLEFFAPWEGAAETSFTVAAKGKEVEVTWEFDQDNDLMGRVMLTFMDMDAMIGADYEQGLANLEKEVAKTVEARLKKEAAAATAARPAEGGDVPAE